jgi:hypothetical protein
VEIVTLTRAARIPNPSGDWFVDAMVIIGRVEMLYIYRSDIAFNNTSNKGRDVTRVPARRVDYPGMPIAQAHHHIMQIIRVANIRARSK